jgi:hypothetical protein
MDESEMLVSRYQTHSPTQLAVDLQSRTIQVEVWGMMQGKQKV